MFATKFFAAAVALFPLAALAGPSCNASPFNSGDYDLKVVTASASVSAKVGQTITATVVDIATCSPYTGTATPLQQLSGHAQNRNIDWTDPNVAQQFSGVTVTGANTVQFVAAVPSGATSLDLLVSGTFGGGQLADWDFVSNNLGVIYTAA